MALAAAVLASACKQGVGDHCEQDSDCESGICSPTQMICESPSTIVVDGATIDRDALVIPDANLVPDGAIPSVPDAPGAPDAAPDAAIVVDAPLVVDAGV